MPKRPWKLNLGQPAAERRHDWSITSAWQIPAARTRMGQLSGTGPRLFDLEQPEVVWSEQPPGFSPFAIRALCGYRGTTQRFFQPRTAAAGIHFPFYIAASALLVGIGILTTAHRLLNQAERVQAEQVTASATAKPAAATVPGVTLIPVAGNAQPGHPAFSVILAAVDGSPIAGLVTEAAATLAEESGSVVHVVHIQEDVTAGDVGIDGESVNAARAVVRHQIDRLAAHHVPAEGQILLHAADHDAAGRMIAEYANTIGARTIVMGAPTHGGLSALVDGKASRELWRHARSNVLVVNPDAPGTPGVRPAGTELL